MADMVNHPPHYNQGEIEPIDVMIAWGIGYSGCLANALKYLARHPYKGTPLLDLQKAEWYLKKAQEIAEAPRTEYMTLSEISADWELTGPAKKALAAIFEATGTRNRDYCLQTAIEAIKKQIDTLN